ncbi:MAG: hypothetical protein ACMXYK_04390, partial [Candidatus Woesearchaeota archaeon]
MVALEALTNLLNNKDPVATAVLLERLNRLNENAEYKNQEKYSLELGSFLREMGIEIMRSRANTEMRISISGENNEPTVESFTDNQQRDTLPIDEYIDRLANEVEVSQSRNKIETTTRHAGKVLRGIWNIERSKTESKYDKILDSLSVAIPGLDDGFYEHIARHLDRDISDIEKNGSISFNRTWFARDPETQKRIVFKLTDRLHKAEKEIGILEKKCEFTSELVGTPFNVG